MIKIREQKKHHHYSMHLLMFFLIPFDLRYHRLGINNSIYKKTINNEEKALPIY
jgi:hypothetical protein